MEIVKNLQRLQGIDGDYDNDSGSGPDRIARRRTIQNLEKASKPRRQIGTLDVAFKKRFLKLTADENNAGNGMCKLYLLALVVNKILLFFFWFFVFSHTYTNQTFDNAC